MLFMWFDLGLSLDALMYTLKYINYNWFTCLVPIVGNPINQTSKIE